MGTTHAVLGLDLSIGNAATQDPADVAGILRAAADRLAAITWQDLDARPIRMTDANGNTVGSVQLSGMWVDDDDDDD